MLSTFKRKLQDGFTLVEILIVVVIVGILAAIAIPTYFNYVEKAYASDANTQIKTLFEEVKIWKTTHADFPENIEEMEDEDAANISAATKKKWDITWDVDINQDGETLSLSSSQDWCPRQVLLAEYTSLELCQEYTEPAADFYGLSPYQISGLIHEDELNFSTAELPTMRDHNLRFINNPIDRPKILKHIQWK